MFHSSADWILENSMKNSTNTGDIMASGNGAITFDTSDYSNPTVPRTITLEGRLYANGVGMSHSAFIIDGCGTVIVDTADMSGVTGNRIEPAVVMPTGSGEKAKLRIDGSRLAAGTYTLLNVSSADAAEHVEVSGTSLEGRRYSVSVEDNKLMLTVTKKNVGVRIIFN